MTMIGTSVAAGVAQTTLQAQQVARQRDRVQSQSTRDARRIHELIQAHADALEEGEELNSTDQLIIDGQLPQHQSPQQNAQQQHHPRQNAPTPPSAPEAYLVPSTPDQHQGANLYRHLDVQA